MNGQLRIPKSGSCDRDPLWTSQNDPSLDRKAARNTIIIAVLGAGLFVLLYGTVRLLNCRENSAEQRAIEMVKTHAASQNQTTLKVHSESAAASNDRTVIWKAKRISKASEDHFEVKSVHLDNSGRRRSWIYECSLESGHVSLLGFEGLKGPRASSMHTEISSNGSAREPAKGQITAIAYSTEVPSAVIDSRIVHEGDTIHGAKVTHIKRDTVHFEKNGKQWSQAVGDAHPRRWR